MNTGTVTLAALAAVAVFAGILLRGQVAHAEAPHPAPRREITPAREDAPAAGQPILWQPGRYRLTLVKGSDQVVKYGEIGWSIPPGWMVHTSGPQACGSGALRPLFAQGAGWNFGSSMEFVSGWQSYRLPFGLYATYMASGNFSAGAHVNTVHAGFYPATSHFIRVVEEGPTSWRVGMDFWLDGRFDDLEMLLEKLE